LKAKEAAKARMAAKTKKSKEVNLPASAADCYAQNRKYFILALQQLFCL